MKLDFVNDNESCMRTMDLACTTKARKKPVVVGSFVLEDDVTFVTSSGEQHGKVGDVVIIGKDHAWPVSPEYFAEHYEVIGAAE